MEGDLYGYATVVITSSSAGISSMQITYHNYVQRQGLNLINGTEDVDASTPGLLTWNDNLTAFGLQGYGTITTSPGGFSINTNNLISNNFQASGTMTTTLNGRIYTQPVNGN